IGTGATLGRVEALDGGEARLRLGSGTVIEVDRVLVAVGRRPATDGLGLAEIGVALDGSGHVRTDSTLATNVKGIWAIGDVTGRMPFTHAAARMGFVAAHNALAPRGRRRQRFDPTPIPWVTFTDPEVGRVGMTEADASERGGRVAYLPLDAVDRAITSGETRGFVKLIAGPRRLLRNTGGGRLLGATVVAPTGGELIHEAALAMRTRMFTGRLAQTTHAYPTWSTAIQQAAAQFFFALDGRSARPARRP
ncbi:MAG: FAD-dependent oxidoreductase, partial [Acidimicrobiales bacterium]